MSGKSLIAILAGFLLLSCEEKPAARSGIYFGTTPPMASAEIFAPGFASTEHHDDMFPVFSPDGREVILRINGKREGKMIAVLYITRMDDSGAWSTPEPLPFLTPHMYGGASFTPDGSRIFFTTKRPLPGEDPDAAHSRIWSAPKTRDGWGEAVPVETPINAFNLNGGCFLDADGTMYASFVAPGRDKHDIYELTPVDGSYPEYHPLPGELNSLEMEVAPYVNSDEGYLLFTAVTQDGLRIKISFRDGDGNWTAPEVVNELTEPEAKFVRMSPDNRYLFFVSHKQTDLSNPLATWTLDEFDEPAVDDPADIFWMDAGFITERVRAWQAGIH